MDEHKTVCAVDIKGYSSGERTRQNHVAMRAGMYDAVEHAFAESGIPWKECFRQDVGDSILVLAPAAVPKGAFAGLLPTALAGALTAYNERHPVEEHLKLRLALNAGEVRFDEHGVAARAVIQACRLLDAQPLKDALAESPGTLAMICSDWFYTEVIIHKSEYAPDTYRKVTVDVKEYSDVGWIRTPGHELRKDAAVWANGVVPAGQRIPVVPVLRPASPEFYDVVDALEEIPCMQGEHTRTLVVDQLRFAGAIRYFPMRRTHVTSILRTCCDYQTGVWELVQIIARSEPPDSIPVNRLWSLLF